MKLRNQIKAILFLGAFTVMLLHNAFPHGHHSHEDIEVVAKSSGHHHHSEHHHSDQEDSDGENQDNLFSLIFTTHSHSIHAHEFVQLSISVNALSLSKVFSSVEVLDVNYDPLIYEERNRNRYALFKDTFRNNYYLPNCSLRAPPAQG
jgi:hypothetical protein